MGYRKPTLVEMYAEVHLAPESLKEAQFFAVVPKLQELGFSDVEFASVGLSFDVDPSAQAMQFPRETKRVRCWKPGKQELAQVGEDLLVVNLTGRYTGWDGFLRLFDEGLRGLRAGLNEVPIRSLNLLTIDRFRVPKDGFTVDSYLNVGGDVVPAWYEASSESLDITLGKGFLEHDHRNRRIQIGVRTNVDPVAILLHSSFHDVVDDGANLHPILERLHGESNKTFESMITDKTRNEVMGGKEK